MLKGHIVVVEGQQQGLGLGQKKNLGEDMAKFFGGGKTIFWGRSGMTKYFGVGW